MCSCHITTVIFYVKCLTRFKYPCPIILSAVISVFVFHDFNLADNFVPCHLDMIYPESLDTTMSLVMKTLGGLVWVTYSYSIVNLLAGLLRFDLTGIDPAYRIIFVKDNPERRKQMGRPRNS